MQVVIRNVTQFPIHHTGSAISSGRYWPALQPHTLAPFTVDQFGVCNLESNVGSGATGGTSFQMVLENDGQGGGQKVDFSIVRVALVITPSKAGADTSITGLGGPSHWSGHDRGRSQRKCTGWICCQHHHRHAKHQYWSLHRSRHRGAGRHTTF